MVILHNFVYFFQKHKHFFQISSFGNTLIRSKIQMLIR